MSVTTLDLKPDSVLVIKGGERELADIDMAAVRAQFPTWSGIVVFMPDDMTVEQLDEQQMNVMGWYRKNCE